VQRLRELSGIDFTTTTPGFRIEVYATDEATVPPDITDSRWAHLRNIPEADASQHIGLRSAGESKYRKVLLWITGGPAEGDRVRLREISLLG